MSEQKREVEKKVIEQYYQQIKTSYQTGKTKSYEWRYKQLHQLRKLITENEKRLEDAMEQDLKSNKFLKFVEVVTCKNSVDDALAQLKDNMKPKKQPNSSLFSLPGTASIHKDPYGLVLIISPWNYPLQLALVPLCGAISAGNCAILKTSEVSPNCSKVLSELVPKYMDGECIKVVTGSIPESTDLLDLRWDLIFYTGNPHVAKIVMKAASKHLTPVVLELGGKSPAIVSKDASISTAAKRIVWGKLLNCGQSCIAPDYVLVEKSISKKLIEEVKNTLQNFHPSEKIEKDEDYSRIINERHSERIAKLIDSNSDKVIYGGKKVDTKNKLIEPTLILNPKKDDPVMQEEIFGPVMPIIEVDNVDDAIEYINEGEKPLALYIFSSSKSTQQKILKSTSSGGVGINETMMQYTCDSLPFGGVGNSGMGAYHGNLNFDTFSHNKSVFDRTTMIEVPMRFPPYTKSKMKLFHLIGGKKLPSFKSLIMFSVPLLVAFYAAYVYYPSKF